MTDQPICTDDGFAVGTTLLESLPQNLPENQTFDYFSSFGRINTVIHINAIDSLGFVRTKAAVKALKRKHHMIAGHDTGVEVAQNSDQYQPTMKGDLQKQSTTGTEFMDLNDDCIREILSRVHVTDLCSLRELSESKNSCNSRLNAIIDDIFARKYKICNLSKAVSTVEEAQRLLINFGPLIIELTTHGRESSRNALDETKCNVAIGILKRFSIISCHCRRFPHSKNVALSNLKKLYVTDCSFDCDIFAHCSKLLELTVTRDIFCDAPISNSMLQYAFPALEIFQIAERRKSKSMKNFISRHKKLKTLGLTSFNDRSDLIPIIANSCIELHTLEISTDGNKNPNKYKIAVQSIASLRHLEHLTIHNDKNPLIFIQQLTYLDSLKELHLSYVRGSAEIISAVSQLRMLEILGFCSCDNITDFNPLVELYGLQKLSISTLSDVSLENFDPEYAVSHLPELKSLSVSRTSYRMDDELHCKIVNARSKAGSDRHSLTFYFNGVEHKFSSK